MKVAWHDEIFKIIEKVFQVRIPFEIVHFPSTGVTSAINRYAEISKNDPDFPCKCLIIDLRAAIFNHDIEFNKKEFFRILISHVEQYLDTKINLEIDENIYHILENIIKTYLQKKKKVLFVFYTTTQINLSTTPEYRDLLIFLDKLRDSTGGNVNFMIATTYPQFDDNNPAPMPLITQYFSYYKKPWIFRSINEDLLKGGKLKKHTVFQIEKLVDLSGGLISLIKGLMRDLIMMDKELEEVETIVVDKDFFTNYPNCKQSVDRIFHQLKKEFVDALISINDGNPLDTINIKALTYLKNTAILDENNTIRGQILPGYLKYAYKDIPEEEVIKSLKTEIAKDDDVEMFLLSPKLKIDRVSGEIFVNSIPQDDYLSEKELKIFTLLYMSANTTVTREQIASSVWGDSSNIDYSDWAIDKLISRIREKLNDMKPNKIIKTVRKSGFTIVK